MAHTQTIKRTKSSAIFRRIAKKDKNAAKACVDTYKNFIWALAQKFTHSTEEAEAATREIYIDIWRYAECGDKTQSAEHLLIAQIARRQLIKHLQ